MNFIQRKGVELLLQFVLRNAFAVRRCGAPIGAVGPKRRIEGGPAHSACRRLLTVSQVRALLRY